jgi:hypothetical protein
MEFTTKQKRLFNDTFTHTDSQIDIHVKNKDFSAFIENGILRVAGYSSSDMMVLRLTNKGKQFINSPN